MACNKQNKGRLRHQLTKFLSCFDKYFLGSSNSFCYSLVSVTLGHASHLRKGTIYCNTGFPLFTDQDETDSEHTEKVGSSSMSKREEGQSSSNTGMCTIITISLLRIISY